MSGPVRNISHPLSPSLILAASPGSWAAHTVSNSCLVTKGFSFLLAWKGGGMGWGDTWAWGMLGGGVQMKDCQLLALYLINLVTHCTFSLCWHFSSRSLASHSVSQYFFLSPHDTWCINFPHNDSDCTEARVRGEEPYLVRHTIHETPRPVPGAPWPPSDVWLMPGHRGQHPALLTIAIQSSIWNRTDALLSKLLVACAVF